MYRPGTTQPIVSTEPKDDPRELPTHSVVPTVTTVYDATPSIYEAVPGAIPGVYAGMPAYLSVPTLVQSSFDISERIYPEAPYMHRHGDIDYSPLGESVETLASNQE